MAYTLDEIKTAQDRLNAMIAAFETASRPVRVLPKTEIVLNPGELYAGLILGKQGTMDYHLILLPGEAKLVAWKDAIEWADDSGGALPTLREQSLLYANLKEEFRMEWYWAITKRAGYPGSAGCQSFIDGAQSYSSKRAKLYIRAVRRVLIGESGL